MKKTLVKRVIGATIGASLIAIGVGFFTRSGIGGDSVSLLYQALTNKFGLSVGKWSFIIGMFELLVPIIFDRKKVGYTTLFYIIIGQYIIDFATYLLPQQNTILMGVVYTTIAIIIISLGSVICLASDMGLSIYDAFCFSITDHFKIKYVIVRYVADGLHLLLAFIFGELFGLGTIICFVTFGFTVDIIKKLIYDKLHAYLRRE